MSYTNQLTNYGSYQYVVTGSNPGPFHTIQTAINQALADGATTTIFVQPGTYTENLTLYSGIDIQGSSEGQVTIIGLHTLPTTGTFTIANCYLVSDTDIFNQADAGTTVVVLQNCTFALLSGYIFNLINWTGDLGITRCLDSSTSNSIINNDSGAALAISDSLVGAGTTTMAVTGVTTIDNSNIFCPITGTGNAVINIDAGSIIDGAITIATPATLSIYNSRVTNGANPCITTTSVGLTTLENVILDCSGATAIAGTGQLELGEVVFNDVSVIAGTITYANASLLGASNINLENVLFLKNSSGTAGQVLTSSGAATPPVWSNPVSTFWQITTTDAVTMVPDNGYIPKNALGHLTTYTLPATSAVGTELEISGFDTHLWTIAQNASQIVNVGSTATTTGVGGSITATSRYDAIRLVCVTSNTVWNLVSSVGNLSVV
jgi:hypothetical protein